MRQHDQICILERRLYMPGEGGSTREDGWICDDGGEDGVYMCLDQREEPPDEGEGGE